MKMGFMDFFRRLSPYNRPVKLVLVGLVMSALMGTTMPLQGFLMVKCIFGMMMPDKE